ncbi:hypothetical protein KM903_12145 [Bacillus glycinifermentans]|uniref:DNA translocase FtsK n=1 Tax=Bacillus glycinifermentans TaxID=1664069 RepID=UPI0015823FE6|nr:DNA translocase FtsK [Bacillus glycinifermentans]MBU8787119.1 hypothetical protein [Bacillus glycinifermentans]NUJ16181.1 hypothetical protein [Bacillus glycinifermentans]
MDRPTYEEVENWVIQNPTGDYRMSIATIQRRFRIGYQRAAMFMERLEKNGIVGPWNGVPGNPRRINKENRRNLVTKAAGAGKGEGN